MNDNLLTCIKHFKDDKLIYTNLYLNQFTTIKYNKNAINKIYKNFSYIL